MTDKVWLPWPPSALRPNAASPGAWRIKQSAAKKYRADCLILAKAAKFKATGSILSVTVCPPDRRRRDLDNILSSLKVAIDALCEVSGVDDYSFDDIVIHRSDVEPGGKILITIG